MDTHVVATPDAIPIAVLRMGWKRSLKRRLAGVHLVFLLTVLVPTTTASIYYGLIASNVYVSESRFVIRGPQRQTATGLGAILQSAGFSRSQDDTYTVHDFMLSRDALRELEQRLDLRKYYGAPSVDRLSRFSGLDGDESFEALYRYYLKRVSISLDTSSSISSLLVRAYSASDAYHMNTMLLEMGERFVNQLNERGRQDMVRFAAAEVAQAETRAKNGALAISEYRNSKGVFDPEPQSAQQLQLVSKLQDELIATKTQLAQIKAFTRRNPQIPVLVQRIETLQSQIEAETFKVAGDTRSLSGKAAEYERLALERTFADKQLGMALASLQQARDDAERTQLYLERIVQPHKPDYAVEPQRLRAVAATLLLGLVTWGLMGILIAGIKEHRN